MVVAAAGTGNVAETEKIRWRKRGDTARKPAPVWNKLKLWRNLTFQQDRDPLREDRVMV